MNNDIEKEIKELKLERKKRAVRTFLKDMDKMSLALLEKGNKELSEKVTVVRKKIHDFYKKKIFKSKFI